MTKKFQDHDLKKSKSTKGIVCSMGKITDRQKTTNLTNGLLAQLVAQLIADRKVIGSNPM